MFFGVCCFGPAPWCCLVVTFTVVTSRGAQEAKKTALWAPSLCPSPSRSCLWECCWLFLSPHGVVLSRTVLFGGVHI